MPATPFDPKTCTMMDDDFMTAVLTDNIPATELILRTILEVPDLEVVSQRTQSTLANLKGRSAVLDVLARDSSGRLYDIEVQNDAANAVPRRARYYSSLIDSSFLGKGEPYKDLPESYVIFITRTDVVGRGLPIYHIERRVEETRCAFGDGSHIVYVNCAYDACGDADPLAMLVHDLQCPDPAKMNFGELAERAGSLKTTDDWREPMLDELYQEAEAAGFEKGRAEGREKGHAEGLEQGLEQGQLKAYCVSTRSMAMATGKSLQEAVCLLDIPEDLRKKVINKLQQEAL